jgi:hypothetical protein
VLPLALIREWFMGRSRDFDASRNTPLMFPADVTIVSFVLRPPLWMLAA